MKEKHFQLLILSPLRRTWGIKMKDEAIFYTYNEYIKILDKEIDWHDKNADICKRKHIIIKILSIFCAIFISIFSVVALIYKFDFAPILNAAIAGCITFLEAISNFMQYDKLHAIYRITCEGLKKEKYSFLTKSEPYSNGEISNLVANCNIILDETKNNWLQIVKKRI